MKRPHKTHRLSIANGKSAALDVPSWICHPAAASGSVSVEPPLPKIPRSISAVETSDQLRSDVIPSPALKVKMGATHFLMTCLLMIADGPARSGLQPHPRYQHHGHSLLFGRAMLLPFIKLGWCAAPFRIAGGGEMLTVETCKTG